MPGLVVGYVLLEHIIRSVVEELELLRRPVSAVERVIAPCSEGHSEKNERDNKG